MGHSFSWLEIEANGYYYRYHEKKGAVYGLLFSLQLAEASCVTTLILTRSKIPDFRRCSMPGTCTGALIFVF